MNRIAMISPHLDDAIFSLGEYMQGKDVTIICPFGGIPEDEVGRKKYEMLHREHHEACEILGVKAINGDFLDDVYPGLDRLELKEWLHSNITTRDFDLVLVPLGIRHPDHIAVRESCDGIYIKNKMYYSDLPYATDYPEEHEMLTKDMTSYSLKEKAVRAYASQTKDDVVDRVMKKERLWI